MSFTASQQEAIAARGNVLLIAGAGTGKTSTLVERCLNCLLDEQSPASLDEILMVTFTDAAANEMRHRIRARLMEEAAKFPEDARRREQLALLDTAAIGTLHSFCFRLVREHFYELELDPQLTVLADQEARLLAEETLDRVMEGHYEGAKDLDEAVRELIQTQARGWDKPIRALVLKIHNYTQTLPDPEKWFADQTALFESPEPTQWQDWLTKAIFDLRADWVQILDPLRVTNSFAADCAEVLRGLNANSSNEEIAGALNRLIKIGTNPPRGSGSKLKPLEEFFEAAGFLASLIRNSADRNPLAEDWNWVRSQMLALLQLTRGFATAFAAEKRESGALDFHDLEQHALTLLWDRTAGKPTPVAEAWRKKLRFVFVDEYQDINAAQDKIIEALSRDGAEANRFLVGDVKQSIYRFRLANPYIFQNYAKTWRDEAGRAIPLADNFRSHESLIGFVNSFFALTMRQELGSVIYDETAQLRFGAPDERGPFSLSANAKPRVELHLRLKGANSENSNGESDDAQATIAASAESEKEARLVAMRLRELKESSLSIWDKEARQFRAVEWRDIAVLLRSPSGKAESYAKEFSRAGVPLVVARGGFYESLEISDLLNLLQLLDNPLQDLPGLAVLRSPLVGLSANDLADIRLAATRQPFWTALLRWHDAQQNSFEKPREESVEIQTLPPPLSHQMGERGRRSGEGNASQIEDAVEEQPHSAANGGAEQNGSADGAHGSTSAVQKVSAFLARFRRWRRLVRQVSLSRCLETVLNDTHYTDWLLTQERGAQRRANVQRLLGLAQQFDQFQRQGLFRFLRFVEAQQEAETEPDVAAVAEENAVRLMSIHQSKGLEFPVVVVADLAKRFNLSDLSADIILDEEYGLCPQIKPPRIGTRYPSLPCWLARRRQKRESLAEELRLFYVAATRARDRLILVTAVSENQFDASWLGDEKRSDSPLNVNCYSDWIRRWFVENRNGAIISTSDVESEGQSDARRLLCWTKHPDAELAGPPANVSDGHGQESKSAVEAADWQKLREELSWQYPFAAATTEPAKTSVTALRRGKRADRDDDAVDLPASGAAKPPDHPTPALPGSKMEDTVQLISKAVTAHRRGDSAAEIGTAHHRFLQLFDLKTPADAESLRAEANRLEREHVLSSDEITVLDFNALAEFWQSEFGRKMAAQAPVIRRELPFTARFSAQELGLLGVGLFAGASADEFVVVQGVADLVAILPGEIWLVDFKTDKVDSAGFAGKVKAYEPQLKLYARALSRIYNRPVTKCRLHFLSAGMTLPVAA